MDKGRGKLDDTLAAMFSNRTYSSNYLFYAHMIGQCEIVIADDLPAPAGVSFTFDHYNLYINPEKFDEHSLEGRLFILQHEMHHILQKHVKRREGRDPKKWNYGTDCAINQLGVQEHMPVNCVYPKTLGEMLNKKVPVNLSSEQYYDMIDEEIKEQMKNGDISDPSEFGEGEGDPELLDDHEMWEESNGDADIQDDVTKEMIEKAETETIKLKGTVPSECSQWLKMFTRKSEVDWKKVLRGITGNKRVGKRPTIMRTNRRFPHRKDLRGNVKDRTFDLLVIADVSGSMSDEAVISTLMEVRHICDITKTDVQLIQIDAQAYTPEKLSKKTKVISRKGFGGTDLFPAIKMAKDHKIEFDAVVVLTDGGLYSDEVAKFKSLNKKVIWLIESSGTILPDMNNGKMQACKLQPFKG